MSPDLVKAAAFSLVVHTGLLWGIGGPTEQVVVDVERDLVSVELELFSPSQLAEPDEVPPVTPPLIDTTKTLETPPAERLQLVAKRVNSRFSLPPDAFFAAAAAASAPRWVFQAFSFCSSFWK